MGNAFNIALVLCTYLISCSFVYGCRRCEMKEELVSPWSYVYVLEKRLGRWSNPCWHGGNLQRNHNELSMKHSSYKKRVLYWEKKEKRDYEKRKERKKHHIPMVNKKIAEMLVVCLPCHFDMGILLYHRARGTPLAVLYDTHVLTMTRTYRWLNLSSMRSGPRIQGTWDF